MTRTPRIIANAQAATTAASLPGLPRVKEGDWDSLLRWISAMTERSEVREGQRGNPFEKALTLRDLKDLTGISNVVHAGTPQGSVILQGANGQQVAMSVENFGELLRNTKLYRDLNSALDDPERFDALGERVKALILPSIAEVAERTGAGIRVFDQTVQSANESFAARVTEVTAAFNKHAAGVRQTLFAAANDIQSQAGITTQITARLDDFDGGSATIEVVMAAVASRTSGLAAEYVVKLSAGHAVAGFGLAASEDPMGNTLSSFIVEADTFSITSPFTFVQESTPTATAIGQTWYKLSTKVSKRATANGTGSWVTFTPKVPFGVDTVNDVIYINAGVVIDGSLLVSGSVTAGALNVTTLSAITASMGALSIDGVLTMGTTGSIKGGQTAYNTGTGFFLGYSGGTYKLSIGNPAGNHLTWDGTNLTLAGALDFADVTGTTKPADNADVTLAAVNAGLPVTGGGITLTAGGAIKGGQTAFDTGTGFFLGYSSAAYKFSIGNASGDKLTWDGTALTVQGYLQGNSSVNIDGGLRCKGVGSTIGALYPSGSTVSIFANWNNEADYGLKSSSNGDGTAAIVGSASGTGQLIGCIGVVGASTADAAGSHGVSGSSTNGVGVTGEVSASTAINGVRAIHGHASGTAFSAYNNGSSKQMHGATASYAAYSPTGGGKQYFVDGAGPFTGFHPGLGRRSETFEVGDIVVDDKILWKPDISNTIGTVVTASKPSQRGVLGVVSDVRELTVEVPADKLKAWRRAYRLIDVNALGEGQINVCGEGGRIDKGDLIVTSSIRGKGMKQADDIVRSYTVAKAREPVKFDDPSQVKSVACIYVCG